MPIKVPIGEVIYKLRGRQRSENDTIKPDTIWHNDKTQENIIHKRGKRSSFSRQVITRHDSTTKANMNRKQPKTYFDIKHCMNRYLAGYRFALSLPSSPANVLSYLPFDKR